MARKARRKQSAAISTLLVELSALAGILGISQPELRDNLWSLIGPRPTAHSTLSAPTPQPFAAEALPPTAQPAPPQPAFLPGPALAAYPSAYTAQATLPPSSANRSRWHGTSFNPMGGYQ
jgi:hypothetical protein